MNKKSAEEIARLRDGWEKDKLAIIDYLKEIDELKAKLATQKENDPPNPLNYPTRCYCGHTDWCECAPKQGEEKCPTCGSICQVGGKEGETKYFIPKK